MQQSHHLFIYVHAGGDSVRRNAHEDIEGYYDNNNQYRYSIREHVVEPPDASTSYGSGARGTTSLTRRPLSHYRYHTATAPGFPGQEVDMSYEV